MMAIIKVKDAAKIQNVVKTLVKVNGKWITASSIKTKVNGLWK